MNSLCIQSHIILRDLCKHKESDKSSPNIKKNSGKSLRRLKKPACKSTILKLYAFA